MDAASMGEASEEASQWSGSRWQRGGFCFRVVFAPRIALRDACNSSARIIGSAKQGELLEVAEVVEGWARLSREESLWRCTGDQIEAWALIDGHSRGLGPLLEMHDPLLPLMMQSSPNCDMQHPAHQSQEDLQQCLQDLCGSVQLVCFLACHISSDERVERFTETLASIARQEPGKPSQIFVSWSASTPLLRHQVRVLLVGVRQRVNVLQTLEQGGQCTQFQHLSACLEGARKHSCASEDSGAGHIWVLFSDDDDLWHSRRCTEYMQVIRTVDTDDDAQSLSVIGATCHAKLFFDEKPRAQTPEDVVKFLELGPKVCRRTNTNGQEDIPEYFDFAVRLGVLADFLQQTPRRILSNRYCDRRFVTWLTSGWCKGCQHPSGHSVSRHSVHWFSPESWLYFYSRCGEVAQVSELSGSYQGGASGAVQVLQQDSQLATTALARACTEEGSAEKELASWLDIREAALLAALLRRSIEEMVVASGDGPVCVMLAWKELWKFCRFAARGLYVDRLQGRAVAGEGAQTWLIQLAEEVALEVCSSLEIHVSDVRS